MSGLSACWVPRNAPVAKSKTRFSYDGSLSAKPGVPGSGGRPMPGGKQSISVGYRSGWMQVQPAAVSWAGVTLFADAGPAGARVPAAATAARAATIRRRHGRCWADRWDVSDRDWVRVRMVIFLDLP